MEVDLRADAGAQFVDVGRDGDAAVHKALEVGPHALEVAGATFAGGGAGLDRFGELEHAAGHAGEERDVAIPCALGDRLDLGRPIGDPGDGGAGFVEVFFGPAREVEGGDAAEVAGVGLDGGGFVEAGEGGGAAENEVFASEHPGVADAGGVVEERVDGGLAEVLQKSVGDRKVFGLPGGGAGGERVEVAMARPEDVGLACFHTLDEREKALVGLQGHAGLEAGVCRVGRDGVSAAIGGVRKLPAEAREGAVLRRHGSCPVAQLASRAGGEKTGAY